MKPEQKKAWSMAPTSHDNYFDTEFADMAEGNLKGCL